MRPNRTRIYTDKKHGYTRINPCLKRKAISFIEILIALLVISICVVPLMRMFTTAVSETTYIDDFLTAIDLGREETEKLKNLALTKEQIEKLGNVVSPPIYLNRKLWRTARVISTDKDPLEAYIYVFQGDDFSNPFITLATAVSK